MKAREKHEGFPGQRLVVVPRPVISVAVQQPLLRELLPTDAGFYPRASNHRCTRRKGCPEAVFIYCADGNGWCELGGRRHEVSKDQLLVIPADTPHAYGAGKRNPWTIHWFHAVGANMRFYLEKLDVTPERSVVRVGSSVQLFSLFDEVLKAVERGFTLAHLLYAAHSLAHLMGLILRYKDEFWHCETNAAERVAKSVEFMRDQLREPLPITTLAAVVNLSRSHYTTLFRRVTGYAPLQYLNHLRMQCAVQLLDTTDLSIKEISDQIGFSDQFYFSRAFRKMYGHAPSEHRRRYNL